MIKKIVRTTDELKFMYKTLKPLKLLGCDVETNGLDFSNMKLLGVGIGSNTKAFYVPWNYEGLDQDQVRLVFNRLFKKPIIFHNAKFDLKVLDLFNFKLPREIHDSMIMAWLSDETTSNGLKQLTKEILKRNPKKFKEVKQEINLFNSEDDLIDDMGFYCIDDVFNTCDLYVHFKKVLKEENIWSAYMKLERHVVRVLKDMETRGIRVDTEWLKLKRDEAKAIIDDLEERMYEVLKAQKGSINFQSSKQLQTILFDKLGYKPVKKTQGGVFSTDNESLEEIIRENELGDDDFVSMILEYREMTKLYQTYLVGLLEQVDKEGIIHASFLQHGTRTGRLSSRGPNLQNIPARSDSWDVRASFIPREGYKFIICDYSQAELRVLAHFSEDETMMEAFRSGADIHAHTMKVTRIKKRKIAKAINFGIIYGMGPRTLGQQLDISQTEAEEYIKLFFKGYPRVRPFINGVQRFAQRHGYIPTLIGRRRRFYGMQERKWFNTVQRQSINTKIQGSAADIMKIAMFKLHKKLKPYKAHQLIQIHDEVVVECPVDKVEEVKSVIKHEMEHAVELKVPMKSEPVEADYWIKG